MKRSARFAYLVAVAIVACGHASSVDGDAGAELRDSGVDGAAAVCESIMCDDTIDAYCARLQASCPTLSPEGFSGPNAGICAWFSGEGVVGGNYTAPVSCQSGARGFATKGDGESLYIFGADGRTAFVLERPYMGPFRCAAGPSGMGFTAACCTSAPNVYVCPADAGAD